MRNTYSYLFLVLFHIIIGVLVYWNEDLAKIYFFSILGYFLYKVFTSGNKERDIQILKACAYFVGVEVFMRTTRGGISYEAGKYVVIIFVLIGMFFRGVSGKSYPYLLYIMLLIPSIFVASTTLSFDANFRTNIAFVLSGPICLGFAAMYCYERKVTYTQLTSILLFMLLPLIAHTSYLYLYVPELKEILNSTASNRSAAGGFGANQVSGVLGLGMFIVATRTLIGSSNLMTLCINLSVFILISYRAITTLSRGGVITAVAAIVVFVIYYYMRSHSKIKQNALRIVFLLFIGTAISWTWAEISSGGITSLRYANKDHLGRDKESIATGRVELFMDELDGFLRSPFLGIGSSRAKDRRIEIEGQGTTSHSEFSRTLAEHGAFGIIILIILIFKPFDKHFKNRRNYFFYSFLIFWFLTINHMSMRIAMPAFIYSLALLKVIPDEKKPSVRRQLPQRAAA